MENVIKQHENRDEAMECVLQTLKQVQADDDPWMVAIWRVRDVGGERRIEMGRVTTSKFPFGDFLAAVGHLSLNLFERAKKATSTLPDKLPPAGFFKREDFSKDQGEGGGNSNG